MNILCARQAEEKADGRCDRAAENLGCRLGPAFEKCLGRESANKRPSRAAMAPPNIPTINVKCWTMALEPEMPVLKIERRKISATGRIIMAARATTRSRCSPLPSHCREAGAGGAIRSATRVLISNGDLMIWNLFRIWKLVYPEPPPLPARYSLRSRWASSYISAGTTLPRRGTFSTTARHSASTSGDTG